MADVSRSISWWLLSHLGVCEIDFFLWFTCGHAKKPVIGIYFVKTSWRSPTVFQKFFFLQGWPWGSPPPREFCLADKRPWRGGVAQFSIAKRKISDQISPKCPLSYGGGHGLGRCVPIRDPIQSCVWNVCIWRWEPWKAEPPQTPVHVSTLQRSLALSVTLGEEVPLASQREGGILHWIVPKVDLWGGQIPPPLLELLFVQCRWYPDVTCNSLRSSDWSHMGFAGKQWKGTLDLNIYVYIGPHIFMYKTYNAYRYVYMICICDIHSHDTHLNNTLIHIYITYIYMIHICDIHLYDTRVCAIYVYYIYAFIWYTFIWNTHIYIRCTMHIYMIFIWMI